MCSFMWSDFFESDMKSWFRINIETKEWRSSWAMACHALWTWRNKEEHDEEFKRPFDPGNCIHMRIREYAAATKLDVESLCRSSISIQIGWTPPDPNFVKLNVDGACKHNFVAGCGGVIRNNLGNWIAGFSKALGCCNSLIAELWGVVEGLNLTKQLGRSKVLVNVDSLDVVKAIEKGHTRKGEGVALLKRIQRLIEMHEEVRIEHTYREANQCADALANIGCTLYSEIVIFESVPMAISNIYDKDKSGSTTDRVIFL